MRKIFLLLVAIVFSYMGLSQEMNFTSEIPEDLIGTWILDLPGEGEIPSQIMKYVFRNDDTEGRVCEFHWLFKRSTDKDYITVAVILGHLQVGNNIFQSKTFKVGSQQIQPMVMEFSDSIQWHYSGDDLFERAPQEETHYYEIQGDTLIIKNDENEDGDYNDEGEIQEYVKSVG